MGVVRNTRALEEGEVPAATEQERKSAQDACQAYAEANMEGGACDPLHASKLLRLSICSHAMSTLHHPCASCV